MAKHKGGEGGCTIFPSTTNSTFNYTERLGTTHTQSNIHTTHDTIWFTHVFRGIRGDLLDLSIDIVQIQKQEQERMAKQQQHKEEKHRRLQEIPREDSEYDISTQEENKPSPRINQREGMNYYGDDMMARYDVHHHQQQHTGDDYYPIIKNHQKVIQETNEVIMKNQFYNDENDIHLPPHVLTQRSLFTPSLFPHTHRLLTLTGMVVES